MCSPPGDCVLSCQICLFSRQSHVFFCHTNIISVHYSTRVTCRYRLIFYQRYSFLSEIGFLCCSQLDFGDGLLPKLQGFWGGWGEQRCFINRFWVSWILAPKKISEQGSKMCFLECLGFFLARFSVRCLLFCFRVWKVYKKKNPQMTGKFGTVLSWDFSSVSFGCDLWSLSPGELCAQRCARSHAVLSWVFQRLRCCCSKKKAPLHRYPYLQSVHFGERAKLVKSWSQVSETLSTFTSCETPSINQQ